MPYQRRETDGGGFGGTLLARGWTFLPGGQSTNAPAATLPTLSVDMDAIRAGVPNLEVAVASVPFHWV